MSHRWFRRVLALCPVAIALLWVAGVAHFHGVAMSVIEWLVVAAATFALHAIGRRLSRPRPLPPLPPNTSPVTLAALAAAVVAVPAALLGGLLELFLEEQLPSDTSWSLRTVWHAACAYAVCYCGFLLRLTAAPSRPPPAA